MNDDQIRQWATEIWGATLWTDLQLQRLKRFATRVVELEREACATIADQHHVPMADTVADLISTAIRARGTA